MSDSIVANKALDQGQGVVRLTPTWVPRSFCIPGKRIKLHPDDYYALGSNRGGIDERWFSSTTPADNGPLTSKNEGLSHIVVEDGSSTELVLLREAVSELKGISSARIFGIHTKRGRCTLSFLTTKALCLFTFTTTMSLPSG